MLKSLNTTFQYSPACFAHSRIQRVRRNKIAAGVLDKTNLSLRFQGRYSEEFRIDLGKALCFIEIVNPLLFPTYIRINGKPYIVKKNDKLVIEKSGRSITVTRTVNRTSHNYCFIVDII